MIYELSSPVKSITGPRIIGEVFRFCPARTAIAGAAADFVGIVFEDDAVFSWFTWLATFDRTLVAAAVGGARIWPVTLFDFA